MLAFFLFSGKDAADADGDGELEGVTLTEADFLDGPPREKTASNRAYEEDDRLGEHDRMMLPLEVKKALLAKSMAAAPTTTSTTPTGAAVATGDASVSTRLSGVSASSECPVDADG